MIVILIGDAEDRVERLRERSATELKSLLDQRKRRLRFFHNINAPACIKTSEEELVRECMSVLQEKTAGSN